MWQNRFWYFWEKWRFSTLKPLKTHYNWVVQDLGVWKNYFSWSNPAGSIYQRLFWLEDDIVMKTLCLHCKLHDLVALRGQRSNKKRYLRIQGRMHFFEKMYQKPLKHFLILPNARSRKMGHIPLKENGFTKQKHIRGDNRLKIYNFGPNVIYFVFEIT